MEASQQSRGKVRSKTILGKTAAGCRKAMQGRAKERERSGKKREEQQELGNAGLQVTADLV